MKMLHKGLLNPREFEIEEEHGWAAVFVDEKLVTVGQDIVDCIWLD